MKDINQEKGRMDFFKSIFIKLSGEKQERVLGYAEGILAHSDKKSKSA